MSQPYIGQIIMFAGTYAPMGYAFCDGSTLAIAEFDALFSLIGTTYGGDGANTFQLPDLRGRAPVSIGPRPGGATFMLGEFGGEEQVTLTTPQLPVHTHPAGTTGKAATANTPAGNLIFADQQGTESTVKVYAPTGASQVALAAASISAIGGGQPHENRQPYLAINYCIALYGVYPSQN